MAVAQEVRMEHISARKADEKFAEFEQAHKRMKELWLNVYNINESNERLTRTISRKNRDLAKLKAELEENLDRIAANLHPTRPLEEIRAAIRAMEDEINDKAEIKVRAARIAHEKQYGKRPEGLNNGWYECNKARLAMSDLETYTGLSCRVDDLRSEFLQMLFERKSKQFRKALGLNESLIEQLKLLLALSPMADLGATLEAILGQEITPQDIKTTRPEDILSFYKRGS